MDRPYLEATIEELEQLVEKYKSDRVIPVQLREELGFRRSRRARQLLREVRGLLEGDLKMLKKPAKPDDPKNQLPLV